LIDTVDELGKDIHSFYVVQTLAKKKEIGYTIPIRKKTIITIINSRNRGGIF